MKLEKALIDFDSHQEKSQSSLRTQLGQQQDDMISKINLLWKTVTKKLGDTPIRNTAGNSAAQMNFTSTNDPTREELRGKGIKNPSKLPSLKYMYYSSLAEQNKNPSSPKHAHFMTLESEEEFEEETKDEIEEEDDDSPKHFDTFPTMNELSYHEWLLKNPLPPWVKAKVRTDNLNNVKFSCMIGHFDKKQAYLDMESPINVMSRLHYNWIMSKRLGPRRKPSNPGKIYNFVGRVKGLKVFVGNFTYECDFMVLEDTTSVINHDLGSVIFGKPFVEATGLIYDREEGIITFGKDKEKIVFKMPHKMEMFKHIDFMDIKTDRIPPFAIESDGDSSEKTYYSDSIDLGSEYKHDENVCRAIRSLIAMKAKRNKGEVT
ncbi:protein kinase-like domain, concanavalin A-like lectin/glucanase domain protein [Tanacetum coccineum]